MSYSFSVPVGPADRLRERAEQAAADCKAAGVRGGYWVEEADGDIAAAITAAEGLTAALGAAADDHVAVTISGHANAGRSAPAGWSNDSVYVSVARAKAPAAEASP
jgi:hypothetical protein